MILERLELERVRRFSPRFACSFAPGLNAVFGPNESGKSTMFQALQAAFFFNPKSTRDEVRSLYAWTEERPFALRLQFREGDFRYSLWKDFHGKELLLEEHSTGKVWRDAKTAQSLIYQLLGLDSPELFAASAAVAQGRLLLPERGKDRRALEEALVEVMTGGGNGGGVARAIELLSKDIQSLTVGLKEKAFKTPGPIKAAEVRLASLHGRYHEVKAACAQRVSHQKTLKTTREELSEVTEALKVKQALLDVEAERHKIEASLAEHKKRYEEIDRRHRALEENKKSLQVIEETLGDLSSAANLEDEDISALQAALARRESLVGPLQEARKAVEETAVPKPWGALALGIFGMVVPLLAGVASPWAGLKAASVAVGLFALAAAGWLWYRRKAALRRLAERRAEARRFEADLEEVAARVRELVERAGGDSHEMVLRRAMEADRCREEQGKLLSERRGLLGGQVAEFIEDERTELLRQMAVAEERLSEERFAGPALDAEGFAELRKDVDALLVRREELVKQVERLRVFLEVSADEAEELAELQETVEEAERQLNRQRHRLRVRELAKAALEEAQQAALAPATERFQQILGRYLGLMSGGRYGAVRMGASMVDLEVLGPERGDFVEPKDLSFGTVEQLLLAARLTLTELLAGPKRPPLLLDEPFGAFDEERLRATMGLLSSIAEERQVILFTHQETIASACEHVVTLPPPRGRSEGGEKTL